MTIPLCESCECQTGLRTFCLNHKVDENEPNTWQSQFPHKPHPGETEPWSSMARFLLHRTTEDKTPRPCGNSRAMSVTQSYCPTTFLHTDRESFKLLLHSDPFLITNLISLQLYQYAIPQTESEILHRISPKPSPFSFYILILYFQDCSPRSQLSLRSYNILVHFIRFSCLPKPCNPPVCSAAKLYADLHASTSCPKQKTLYTFSSKLIF